MTANKTTTATITAEQICLIDREAGCSGNMALCAICRRALAGDVAARATCARYWNG